MVNSLYFVRTMFLTIIRLCAHFFHPTLSTLSQSFKLSGDNHWAVLMDNLSCTCNVERLKRLFLQTI